MNKALLSIGFVYLWLLIFNGCGTLQQNDKVTPVPSNEHKGLQRQAILPDKPSDFLKSGIFRSNPKALVAWQQFIQDGRFRVADGNDFDFSDASKIKLKGMFEEGWYDRINHPAITGNIDREDGFKDLAVIVIDTTRSDPSKFGIVIFNVPESDRTKPSTHWLFSRRDLSATILSWHSNWPVVVFYEEDGSSNPYYINWDKTQRKYFVDKEQKGPDARSNNRLHDKG